MSEAVRTGNLRVLAMTTPPRTRRYVAPKRIVFTPDMVAMVHLERGREHPTSWARLAEMLGVSLGLVFRWGFENGFAGARASRVFHAAKSERLRVVWSDPAISLAAICRELQVDHDTAKREAGRLGLGVRPPLALPLPPLEPTAPKPDFTPEWPEQKVKLFLALYAEGLSASLIGQRLGITKSAVIGKVHRMRLPPRAAPTGRGRAWWAERRAKKQAETPKPIVVSRPVIAAPEPRPQAPVIKLYTSRSEPCCWVMGEPAGRHTKFCDVPSLQGDSLCAEHRALSHRRATNRVTANAA